MASTDINTPSDFSILRQSRLTSPEVSVIVPIYNKAHDHLLSRCLESLIDQSIAALEIICVDDHSDDESLAMALSYAEKVDNITVVSMDRNRKQGTARNRGIALSRGRYIGFVDADDSVSPLAFSTLHDSITTSGADAVVAPYQLVDLHDKIIEPQKRNTPLSCDGPIGIDERKTLVLCHDPIWAHLFKASLIKLQDMLFPEDMLYEDTPTLLRWLYGIHTMSVIEGESFYNYRQYGSSTVSTTVKSSQALHDRIASSDMILNDARSLGMYNIYEDELSCYFMDICYFNTVAMLTGSELPSSKAFIRSLAQHVIEQVPDYLSNPYYARRPLLERTVKRITLLHPIAAYRARRSLNKLFRTVRSFRNHA